LPPQLGFLKTTFAQLFVPSSIVKSLLFVLIAVLLEFVVSLVLLVESNIAVMVLVVVVFIDVVVMSQKVVMSFV
jgi:hypothetical protein